MRRDILSLIVFVAAGLPASAATLIVRPDGTGDFPNIQTAISAAANGDSIILGTGIFTGHGNRDLDYTGKRLVIRSATGDPQMCYIDCGGNVTEPHRGVLFRSGETTECVFSGVTIMNGYAPSTGGWSRGGGILCVNGSSPTIYSCVFLRNAAGKSGGGLHCREGSSPGVHQCGFLHNTSSTGAAICSAEGANAVLTSCTLAANCGTNHGNIIYLGADVNITITSCIIAQSVEGRPVFCDDGTALLTCCDIYGNPDGDWIGCIANQYGISGNISEDPQFCDPDAGDFSIHRTSPCAPENNPVCGWIGAYPVGCGILLTVEPDGSGDYPTIQAAINAAVNSAVIQLGSGRFHGEGNRDLDFLGKAITVESEAGDPEASVIDCEGAWIEPHRGITFQSGEGNRSVLRCVTISNAAAIGDGGAILCVGASPILDNCILRGNRTSGWGGAVVCRQGAAPLIQRCTLCANHAAGGGGGLFLDSSNPSILACTIASNSSPIGSGLALQASSPDLAKTIIAFGTSDRAVRLDAASNPVLACCDIYGNEGGDWVGPPRFAYQSEQNGNLSADPCFCDPVGEDYRLWNFSPCNQGGPCGLIGAWLVGCTDPQSLGPVGADAGDVSWFGCYPSPATSDARFTYFVPATHAGNLALRVVDGAGRQVRIMALVARPGEVSTAGWDLRDAAGSPVPAGAYFVRLMMNGRRLSTTRLVVIR